MTHQDSTRELIITKGEDASFTIYLVNTDNRPVDLTAFTDFRLCLEADTGDPIEITHVANANGSTINKTAPDVLGQLDVVLDQVDTALLREGFSQDIDIEWGDGTTRKRKRLAKALNVQGSICPS